MKHIIVLGASGNIATHVINLVSNRDDIKLTLFARNKRNLRVKNLANCRIIEGDVLNYAQLKAAVVGQDLVYANLAGDLEAMARNIVKAMDENGVKKLIFISSIGIYKTPLRAVLKPYREAADVIEESDPRLHHIETDMVYEYRRDRLRVNGKRRTGKRLGNFREEPCNSHREDYRFPRTICSSKPGR